MGSDWQNLYLPGLVNAAFTLSLKKKNTLFSDYPLLKSLVRLRLGWMGAGWLVGC